MRIYIIWKCQNICDNVVLSLGKCICWKHIFWALLACTTWRLLVSLTKFNRSCRYKPAQRLAPNFFISKLVLSTFQNRFEFLYLTVLGRCHVLHLKNLGHKQDTWYDFWIYSSCTQNGKEVFPYFGEKIITQVFISLDSAPGCHKTQKLSRDAMFLCTPVRPYFFFCFSFLPEFWTAQNAKIPKDKYT